MSILDYTKELVTEIYNRQPNWSHPIEVYPDKIIIKESGRFPCVYTIEIENEEFIITAEYDNATIPTSCDTINEIVDFILE